jgi:ABC-type lipoprotein export system ATPase subunit
VITLSEVSFAYPRSGPIIHNCDVVFQRGAVTAVTGPSGRGKSTLLYLAGLLLKPRAGSVRIADTETTTLSDWERSWLRAHHMGFVFQDAALDLSRTVLDNVLETSVYTGLPRRLARRRAYDLLERFGVSLRVEHRPGQVSGGQAQRVALCRALLNEPPVIIADEPTGNLDSESAAVVLDTFHELSVRGATVIVATHDPAVVARCDVSVGV